MLVLTGKLLVALLESPVIVITLLITVYAAVYSVYVATPGAAV